MKIKPINKSQLSVKYDISTKTLNKWLEPHWQIIGEYKGRCFTINQLKIIFRLIGKPF